RASLGTGASGWLDYLSSLICRMRGLGLRLRAIVAGFLGFRCPLSWILGCLGVRGGRGGGRFLGRRPRLGGGRRGVWAGGAIPLGSPIAGRTDHALDDLVGFFVNTLVLRTDTSGQPSFRDLIKRVRAGNLAAYGQQDVPFERLVEALNPARSLARHPLFQVMLAFQNNEVVGLELAGLRTRVEAVSTGSAKFDLSVSLGERRSGDGTPAGIAGVIEYAADLFERADVVELSARFVRLLAAAVCAPDRAIGRLELMAPAERARLLGEFNGQPQALASGTLVERFAAQARATPDATALICGQERLSYGELERAANPLAQQLRGRGG